MRVLAAAVSIAAALAVASPAMADVTYGSPSAPKGAALLIHGGAFVGGSATDLRREAKALAKRGFYAVSIDYPLGYAPAIAAVRAKADELGPDVVAFGVSAGGGMAVTLAAEGRVTYAVAWAPAGPSWHLGPGAGIPADAWDRDGGSAPVRIWHNRKDPVVEAADTITYARAHRPGVRLTLTGWGPDHALPRVVGREMIDTLAAL